MKIKATLEDLLSLGVPLDLKALAKLIKDGKASIDPKTTDKEAKVGNGR